MSIVPAGPFLVDLLPLPWPKNARRVDKPQRVHDRAGNASESSGATAQPSADRLRSHGLIGQLLVKGNLISRVWAPPRSRRISLHRMSILALCALSIRAAFQLMTCRPRQPTPSTTISVLHCHVKTSPACGCQTRFSQCVADSSGDTLHVLLSIRWRWRACAADPSILLFLSIGVRPTLPRSHP